MAATKFGRLISEEKNHPDKEGISSERIQSSQKWQFWIAIIAPGLMKNLLMRLH